MNGAMGLGKIVALALLAGCAGAAHAQNQYRCDCTTVVDTCTANVSARGSFLEVKTDRPQCARVDYFVDGQPFVSMVVDGEDRQNWLARTANPKILVQSCQVCRDNGANAAAPAARAAPAAAATEKPEGDANRGLKPLISVAPEYPPGALVRELKGHVDVEFTVNPAGRVEKARVVTAEPKGVFDAAAVAAVERRRYAYDPTREPQVVTERLEFQPPRRAGGRAIAASGPRNQCVRQDAVYNYGEMVDVGLINACAEPLLVFGCAQGTGRSAGRWVCSTSEERGDVLVGTSDQRIGKRYTAGDASLARTYTYTDSFSVTRAPNSEYWWVACAESDDACRTGARQWTRAVSGQDATIDPEDRSPVTVARSY
jgi:TonB family protein